MVVLEENKKLDTNILRDFFQDSKMSFFEEELMIQKVNLRPGSISPFALVNNKEKDIKVVFDIELQNTTIGFHPLQNDNTVVLNMKDVELFLDNV
jgi:Ala-tRNA(Pro) deacylase